MAEGALSKEIGAKQLCKTSWATVRGSGTLNKDFLTYPKSSPAMDSTGQTRPCAREQTETSIVYYKG